MEFKPKTEAELTQTMIDVVAGNTTKVNDFTPGSKLRTILHAVASIGATLYQKVNKLIKDAIEEAIYTTFNFPADPGKRATTTITLSRADNATQDYIISAGTLVATSTSDGSDEVLYTTDETVILQAGTTSITVKITAISAGIKANVQIGRITVLKTKPVGVEAVTNPTAVYDGKEPETRDQRQKRFRDYVAGFSRGTTNALRYAAKTVPGVVEAETIENPQLMVFTGGASYQDISNECNRPYGTGVVLVPTVIGEALYIGAVDKYNMVWFQLLQVGVGGVGVWEYWNGATWQTLTVTDNTLMLKQIGAITFSPPTSWRASKVNGVFMFWVRFRLTTTYTPTAPTAYHVFASPPPGWVDLYVQDTNASASADMKQAVVAALKDYRGHGITVNVMGPTVRQVNILAQVVLEDGYDRASKAEELRLSVIDYLNTFKMGDDLHYSRLITEIIRMGRGSVRDATLTDPDTDIFAAGGEIIRPGTVSVVVSN